MLVAEKNALSEEIESYVDKYGNDRSALLMNQKEWSIQQAAKKHLEVTLLLRAISLLCSSLPTGSSIRRPVSEQISKTPL